MTFPTLYKLDSIGRLRTWRMELNTETGQYRTLAGLADGKQATSEWTTPVPKSKPTAAEQGRFEVESAYRHQLDREYHETADTVSTAKIIEPMLAKTFSKFAGPVMAQPKLDGIRCIATIDGLVSRQGQPITAVPHITEALEPLFSQFPDAILDGELYNHDLREDFGAISSIVRKKAPTVDQLAKARDVMQYHVYDLISGTGDFPARKGQLIGVIFMESNVDTVNGPIKLVTSRWAQTSEELDALYGQWTSEGYEGQMVRIPGFNYELGRRSKSLLKRKEFITEEFPVVAIDEGQGNWSGAAKRFTLELPNGKQFGAGVRGSYDAQVEMLKHPPTEGVSTATVRYFMLSPDGVPRFPVVIDYQPNGRND